jgi:hypothetical protein
MINLAELRGTLTGKRVELICKYKNGEQGRVFMECINPEDNQPYMYVKLDKNEQYEVFWYGEVMLVEE